MTYPSGNSEFCFPSTPNQNSLFPMGQSFMSLNVSRVEVEERFEIRGEKLFSKEPVINCFAETRYAKD